MQQIDFTIEGKVVPKARPRFANGRAYTPKSTQEYEQYVKLVASRVCEVHACPVKLVLNIKVGMPASWSKKRREAMLHTPVTKRPDLDNRIKAILDGLNGVAYQDDSQVFEIHAKQLYHEDEGVDVTLIYHEDN